MTRIRIPPLDLHPGQRRIIDSNARFRVISAGRRFGKTLLAVEWLSLMEGGAIEGKPVAFFAPTYKLLLDVWSDFERTLKPVTAKANKTEMRIELITGGKIDFWTLEDADAGRGRKYARVVLDEAAHARVHDEVRADLMRSDARALAATLTRELIAPLLALNLPDAPMPLLTLMVEEPEDMGALAEQLAKLVPLGLPIPQAWVREKWGIPEAKPDEPVLGHQGSGVRDQGSEGAQAAHRRMQSVHAAQGEAAPDALDELAAEALAGWEAQLSPMVDPLQALLDRAAQEGWTARQLIDALPQVLPQMDGAALAEALARAQFVARLAGVHGREPGRE